MEKRTNNDLHNTKGYSGRGEHHFFNSSVGCGGETIFFYVGIRFVVLRDRAILPEFAPKQ